MLIGDDWSQKSLPSSGKSVGDESDKISSSRFRSDDNDVTMDVLETEISPEMHENGAGSPRENGVEQNGDTSSSEVKTGESVSGPDEGNPVMDWKVVQVAGESEVQSGGIGSGSPLPAPSRLWNPDDRKSPHKRKKRPSALALHRVGEESGSINGMSSGDIPNDLDNAQANINGLAQKSNTSVRNSAFPMPMYPPTPGSFSGSRRGSSSASSALPMSSLTDPTMMWDVVDRPFPGIVQTSRRRKKRRSVLKSLEFKV